MVLRITCWILDHRSHYLPEEILKFSIDRSHITLHPLAQGQQLLAYQGKLCNMNGTRTSVYQVTNKDVITELTRKSKNITGYSLLAKFRVRVLIDLCTPEPVYYLGGQENNLDCYVQSLFKGSVGKGRVMIVIYSGSTAAGHVG